MKPKPLRERFWSKVEKGEPKECWIWTGQIAKNGYGRIKEGTHDSIPLWAHRVSFAIAFGEILPGFDVHHACHNRACVNPDHLQIIDHWGHGHDSEDFRTNASLRTLQVD